MGRTLIAPVSYGLGDLVVSLPAIQALIADRPPVWLVARAASQRLLAERVAGLHGIVDEAELTGDPEDSLIDLRDHPLQRDVWWGSAAFAAEFGSMNINEILDRICRDFAINADFAHPRALQANQRLHLRRTVLLVHETDGPDKQWPTGHWAAVAAMLRDDGYDVAQVTRGQGPSPLDAFAIPAVVAPTPGDAVDVLSACQAVIGIDTGLTHIAVQQGTPTVTICRPRSVYVRPWPHSAALRGAPCTVECVETEASYAYNHTVSLRHFRPPARRCPSGSPCLAAARPEHAVRLLRDLL
jgi:Glycosyltransferase family 9 (heptosyltransferase)